MRKQRCTPMEPLLLEERRAIKDLASAEIDYRSDLTDRALMERRAEVNALRLRATTLMAEIDALVIRQQAIAAVRRSRR